jgi:hypothetical protein
VARKLGKKAGAVRDRRTLHLSEFLTIDQVPERWRIAASQADWPVFGNDRVGDCTCASLCGHRVLAQERSARQNETPVTTDDVLRVYGVITGWPQQDPGAYLIDVLREVRSNGFGMERDGTRHTIGAYADVAPLRHDHVKVGAHLFGGLYLGVGLPSSASDEINQGRAWEATADPAYSWGGHAVWLVGYDAHSVTVVTWGQEQKASWEWWDKYVDEAWAVISEDFLTKRERTPQGLDVAALEEALEALGQL